jgi:hypothetical protein
MSYQRETSTVLNWAQTSWNGFLAGQRKLHGASQIKPSAPNEVFKALPHADGVELAVGPVVLNVPPHARANDRNLYVVLKGHVLLDGESVRSGEPKAIHYRSVVGYFIYREGANKLHHVYGIHFDMDKSPGHPVFHSQMSSQRALGYQVRERFRLDGEVDDEAISTILDRIRIPTAQMDPFSVLTQVGADHWIHSGSSPKVLADFDELRSACDFFHGAVDQIDHLGVPEANRCYRSTHWYPRQR